jgi:hypothetical protein
VTEEQDVAPFSWIAVLIGCTAFLTSAFLLATWPLWRFTQKENLAIASLAAGKWAEAESRSRDGLEAAGKLARERGQAIYAMGLVLCRALQRQRKFAEAEEEARRVMELVPVVSKPGEKSGRARLHLLIGELLLERGRLEDAAGEAEKAELLRPEGNERFDVGYLGLRAAIARGRGDFGEALGWAEELQKRLAASKHYQVRAEAGAAALLRSAMYGEALQPEKGVELAQEEVALRESDPEQRASALHVFGALCSKLNRLSDAEQAHREELALLSRVHGNDDIRMAAPLIHLAVALAKNGQAEGAADALLQVRRLPGDLRKEERSAWLFGLGMTRAMEGKLEESAMALRESVALDESRTRIGHPVTVDGLWALAQVTEALGQAEGADALRRRVDEIRREYAGIG